MADCPKIPVARQGAQIRLPGGVALSPGTGSVTPSALMVAKNLTSQANSALGPLAPIFNIVDAVLAVKDFAESVPDVVTNPGSVVEAIGKLVEKIDKLASLVPQLSVPLMIVDTIDVVLDILSGMVVTLDAIVAQNIRIAAAKTKAEEPGNEALLPIIECAESLNAEYLVSLEASTEPLNRFMGVLNLFLELIGLEPLPTVSDLGDDPEEAIQLLRDFEQILRTARDAIPIP